MSSDSSVKNFSKHNLSIGGQTITISSDQPSEKIKKIEELANSKINQSLKSNLSFQKSLLLALLQCCEDYVSLEEGLETKVRDIEEHSQMLLEKFNNALI